MMNYVKEGGFFSLDVIGKFGGKDKQLISIAQLPDNQEYIHNGHHRVLAIYLAGREYIRDDEYVNVSRTYGQYMTCNFDSDYLTPFDPRKYTRIPDFSEFKAEIRDMVKKKISPIEISRHIKLNDVRYKVVRKGDHIHYLAQQILPGYRSSCS
jgi:hypothetical protein